MSADLIERIKNELKDLMAVNIVFATTECNVVAGYVLPLHNFSSEKFNSCIGQPYPFVECKIVDPATGRIQPLNVEGELHVKSPSITAGYWNDPEMTRKSKDIFGWYFSIINFILI